MPATSPRASVVLREELAARILGRAERGMRPAALSAAAAAELGVFDTLLGQELRRIRLTLAEARALASVVGGDLVDPYATGLLLFAEASDAFRLARQGPSGDVSSYAATFGIDEQVVLDKLLAVGPAADLALRDALSRWWARPGDTSTGDTSTGDTSTGDTSTGDTSSSDTAADDVEAAAFRDVGITIVPATIVPAGV